MHGYDDINGFTKMTGMDNYKILSKYNIDNALAKWAVIEKINGLAIADAIMPQVTGTAEFNDIPTAEIITPRQPSPVAAPQAVIPAPQLAAEPAPENRMPPAAPLRADSPPAPSIAQPAITPLPQHAPVFSAHEKARYGSLFKRDAGPSQVETAEPQRDLPLKTLFDRIASCR